MNPSYNSGEMMKVLAIVFIVIGFVSLIGGLIEPDNEVLGIGLIMIMSGIIVGLAGNVEAKKVNEKRYKQYLQKKNEYDEHYRHQLELNEYLHRQHRDRHRRKPQNSPDLDEY